MKKLVGSLVVLLGLIFVAQGAGESITLLGEWEWRGARLCTNSTGVLTVETQKGSKITGKYACAFERTFTGSEKNGILELQFHEGTYMELELKEENGTLVLEGWMRPSASRRTYNAKFYRR